MGHGGTLWYRVWVGTVGQMGTVAYLGRIGHCGACGVCGQGWALWGTWAWVGTMGHVGADEYWAQMGTMGQGWVLQRIGQRGTLGGTRSVRAEGTLGGTWVLWGATVALWCLCAGSDGCWGHGWAQASSAEAQAVRALVLVPSKELGQQVVRSLRQLAAFCSRDLRVADLCAQTDLAAQR